MTKRTRYFLFGAIGALLVGLSGGLIAYLAYDRSAGVPAGLPRPVLGPNDACTGDGPAGVAGAAPPGATHASAF